jgi:hypothetical protein
MKDKIVKRAYVGKMLLLRAIKTALGGLVFE